MQFPVKFSVVLLACCGSWSHADAPELLTRELLSPELFLPEPLSSEPLTQTPLSQSDAGLTLFMSADEQSSLERSQVNVSLPDSEASVADTTSKSSTVSEDNGKLIRYDGIVLNGDRVLGAWFNGNRLSNLNGLTGLKLGVVDSAGQLLLVKGDHSSVLLPGDQFISHGFMENPAVSVESLDGAEAEQIVNADELNSTDDPTDSRQPDTNQ